MKTILITRGSAASLLTALALLLFSAGCAAPPQTDWAGRVGNYTFDRAVRELGQPEKSSPSKDGTRVVDWVTRHGVVRPYPAFGYGYPDRYPGQFGINNLQTSPDYILRLTFGSDGELKSWKNLVR